MKMRIMVLALLVGAASTVALADGGKRKGYANKTPAERQDWCQRHGGTFTNNQCTGATRGKEKGSHKGGGQRRQGRCQGGACPRRQGAAAAAVSQPAEYEVAG